MYKWRSSVVLTDYYNPHLCTMEYYEPYKPRYLFWQVANNLLRCHIAIVFLLHCCNSIVIERIFWFMFQRKCFTFSWDPHSLVFMISIHSALKSECHNSHALESCVVHIVSCGRLELSPRCLCFNLDSLKCKKYLCDKLEAATKHSIPPELILNSDQTPSSYVSR